MIVGQPGQRSAAADMIIGQPGQRPAAADMIVGQPGQRPAAADMTVALADAGATGVSGARERRNLER